MKHKYIAGLTPSQRVLQERLIRKSQKIYEETGKVEDRKKVSFADTPRSMHAIEFEAKYGFPITNLKKVKEIFPDTDIQGILAKGRAAYMSSGSRPNVSANQWAYARLASALLGHKAFQIDKDLIGEESREEIL